MRYIVPTLKAQSTIRRIHTAIMAKEEVVYIDRAMFLFKLLDTVLPLGLDNAGILKVINYNLIRKAKVN